MYGAKCLTLPGYRAGRILFAGDAAHLVPIFGVRGLNSGLDDAGNLAWKLALVHRGAAPEALLDSYSSERVAAARENIAYGAKSAEFMAPPHAGFALMREAALRLALVAPRGTRTHQSAADIARRIFGLAAESAGRGNLPWRRARGNAGARSQGPLSWEPPT